MAEFGAQTRESPAATVARPAARARYGTVAWARTSNGRMSRREQLREIARATAVLAAMMPARARQRLGIANPRAIAFDIEQLVIPDSAVAREAEELCREASSKQLLAHCLRTYAWGMILGRGDGLRPDEELFYVASMLHDLALTDSFRDYHPMPCFAARAGILATDWASERGWPEHRCTKLGDAVSLHLNGSVAAPHGPEAQLLQAGAALDVIGLRHWDLTPGTVAAVLDRYPRRAFKSSYAMFRAEAHPRTRTELLDRWLLFGQLIAHSQFAD